MHTIVIFLLGFSSGLPFLLILSTLSLWLSEAGVSKTMIGALAFVSIPYTFKFIWGAMVDTQEIPFLTRNLGRRRSWILVSQMLIWIFLWGLGATNPFLNVWKTAIFALCVGCGSAIQDIAIEAYRIEILPTKKIGVGASLCVLGYRFGMLCSGAGTIFLAAFFGSWNYAYHYIASFMSIGIITTIIAKEPNTYRKVPRVPFRLAVKAFAKKLNWRIILPFILSYKIADTILNVMSMPFLVEIGFNNLEIAYVAKTFGIGAMILGGVIGGFIVYRSNIRNSLILCVLLQALSSILFMVQAILGHNLSFLFISMGVENLACGMSQVALISYLSYLCNKKYAALQYAILTSFASLIRVSFSAIAGVLADHFAWTQFYAIVCISCIPSFILLVLCVNHFAQVDDQPEILELNNEEIVNVN